MLRLHLLNFLILSSFNGFAQKIVTSSEWSVEASYPRGGVDDGSAFVVGESIYMGCGIDQSFSNRNDWWRYNTNTREWKELDTLPASPRQYASSFSYLSRGYLMGGIAVDGLTNQCFEFDATTELWKELSEPPWTPRASMASFVIDDHAYLLGGRNDSMRFDGVWQYHMPSKTWKQVTTLPIGPHDELVAFSIGREGYITQGRSDSSTNSEVWKLDTRDMSWTRLQDFPGGSRSYAAAVSTAFGAMVVGGQNDALELMRACYYYNAEDDIWSEITALPEDLPIRGMDLVVSGETVYTFGGLTERYTRVADLLSLDLIEYTQGEGLTSFKLYPNPVNEMLYVQAKRPLSLKLVIMISDIMGRTVKSHGFPINQTFITLDLNSLQSGKYDLRIYDSKRLQLYHHQRFVITE